MDERDEEPTGDRPEKRLRRSQRLAAADAAAAAAAAGAAASGAGVQHDGLIDEGTSEVAQDRRKTGDTDRRVTTSSTERDLAQGERRQANRRKARVDAPGTASSGVRIAAVEAAVAAGLAPSTGRRYYEPRQPAGRARGLRAGARVPAPIELPDWTDAPTGQVPKILLGDDVEASGDGVAMRGPTWREDRTDWEDDLDLSFLVEEGESVGIAGHSSEPDLETELFDFDFGDLDRALGTSRLIPPSAVPSPTSEPARPVEDDTNGPSDDQAWKSLHGGGDDVAPVATFEGEPAANWVRRDRKRTSSRRTKRAESASHELSPRAGGRGRRPLQATVTGLLVGGVAIGCFAGGSVSALVLVSVLVAIAAGEAYGALRRGGYRPASIVGIVAAPAMVVGAYLRGASAYPVVLGITVLMIFAWYLLGGLRATTTARYDVANLGASILVVVWVGVLGAFAGLLLSPARFPHRHGVALLLAAVAITVAADVGAYAAGALFGRHRLAPAISPNKSWEGFVGGAVLGLAVAAGIISHLHPFTMAHALELAAIVVVVAPIGDLAESLVKRDLGLKDMGTLLPEHGGVLDRLDAMLFVLPLAYFFVELAHVG